MEKGGTYMWCPNCKGPNTCSGVNGKIDEDGIYFVRTRKCKTCNRTFKTTELPAHDLKALQKDKKLLEILKSELATLMEQTKQAQALLENMCENVAMMTKTKIFDPFGNTVPIPKSSKKPRPT